MSESELLLHCFSLSGGWSMDLDIPGGPRYDGRFDETAEWWRDQISGCAVVATWWCSRFVYEFEVNHSIYEWFEMIRLERMRLPDGQSPEED